MERIERHQGLLQEEKKPRARDGFGRSKSVLLKWAWATTAFSYVVWRPLVATRTAEIQQKGKIKLN